MTQLITHTYVILDLFPEPIDGKWNWFHDGKTKTMVLTLHKDNTASSSYRRNHGVWDYNQNSEILSWDPQVGNLEVHKLYFSCKQNKAILYQPKRNPTSVMQKADNKVGN